MPEIIQGNLLWGTRARWGGITDPGIYKGMSSAFAWTSDPKDTRSARDCQLTLTAPATAVPAMLVVPSTTVGCGLLFVAQATGAGGNAISITVNAPSGPTTTISAISNAVTIAPALGLQNLALTQLFNASPQSSLATAYLWGWNPNGNADVSWQPDPMELSRNDLVAAFATTNLAGGCAAGAAAPDGQINIFGSGDAVNWSTSALATLAFSGNGTQPVINIPSGFPRFLQAAWVPAAGGSLGAIFGEWTGKGLS